MAKEQVAVETMELVNEEQLQEKPVAVEPLEEPAAPQPEPVEKPKPAKKMAIGNKLVCYTGKNPSYTIGRHRFLKGGAAQEVDKELADYALKLGCFEEV